MSEIRYIVTVRGDAAHALEINLETATRVLLGIHAPYPRGRGIEVLGVERAPRGDQGPVPLYDGHGLPPCPCCNGRPAGQDTAVLAELGVDFPPEPGLPVVPAAAGPKDSTDDYPADCYEVHAGIRPPSRTRGKVRAIVFEKTEGGGIDIYTCEHDHAPGVTRCQDISPDQMAEVIECGRVWVTREMAGERLAVLPIVWERT